MRPITHVHPDTGAVVRRSAGRVCRCGKIAYSNRKIANAEAKRINREMGDDVEVYHDYGCHALHVGHHPEPYDPEIARGLKPSRRQRLVS